MLARQLTARLALGRAHDLLLQARWTSADLGKIVRGATEAFDNPDVPKFTIAGPDVRMTSGAVIAIAMTLKQCRRQHFSDVESSVGDVRFSG
jgi:two-component sensor histidine kinase